MKSIDKLRDLADDINAKEIVEHIQLYPNCVFDCHWLDGWHSEFNRLIESLEAEIAERYMLLPCDYDGEPLHIGDITNEGKVARMIVSDDGESSVYVYKLPNVLHEFACYEVEHVKPRTLEDVLRDVWKEALDYAKSDIWRNPDEVFAERADEIEAEIERDYMRLPVDADGVPIHVGDVLECDANGYKGTFTVFAIGNNTVVGNHDIEWIRDNPSKWFHVASFCCHVKPRTLEDVLMDAGVSRAAISDVADEIRELLGFEIDEPDTIRNELEDNGEMLGGDAE